jgi:hypothetical protein
MTARRPARTLRRAGIRSGWSPDRRGHERPACASRLVRDRFTMHEVEQSFTLGMNVGHLAGEDRFRAEAGFDAMQARMWDAYLTGKADGDVETRYRYVVEAVLDHDGDLGKAYRVKSLDDLTDEQVRALQADLVQVVGHVSQLVHDLGARRQGWQERRRRFRLIQGGKAEELTAAEWPELDEEAE